MNFDQIFQLNQQHQDDLHRQAEQRRLAASAQQARPNIVLSALGQRMVNLGHKLQEMAETEKQQPIILQPEPR